VRLSGPRGGAGMALPPFPLHPQGPCPDAGRLCAAPGTRTDRLDELKAETARASSGITVGGRAAALPNRQRNHEQVPKVFCGASLRQPRRHRSHHRQPPDCGARGAPPGSGASCGPTKGHHRNHLVAHLFFQNQTGGPRFFSVVGGGWASGASSLIGARPTRLTRVRARYRPA